MNHYQIVRFMCAALCLPFAASAQLIFEQDDNSFRGRQERSGNMIIRRSDSQSQQNPRSDSSRNQNFQPLEQLDPAGPLQFDPDKLPEDRSNRILKPSRERQATREQLDPPSRWQIDPNVLPKGWNDQDSQPTIRRIRQQPMQQFDPNRNRRPGTTSFDPRKLPDDDSPTHLDPDALEKIKKQSNNRKDRSDRKKDDDRWEDVLRQLGIDIRGGVDVWLRGGKRIRQPFGRFDRDHRQFKNIRYYSVDRDSYLRYLLIIAIKTGRPVYVSYRGVGERIIIPARYVVHENGRETVIAEDVFYTNGEHERGRTRLNVDDIRRLQLLDR